MAVFTHLLFLFVELGPKVVHKFNKHLKKKRLSTRLDINQFLFLSCYRDVDRQNCMSGWIKKIIRTVVVGMQTGHCRLRMKRKRPPTYLMKMQRTS